MTSEYVGTELELFANAHNWKAYWSRLLRPYVGKNVLDVGAGIGATAKAFSDLQFARFLALEPDAAMAQRMQEDAQAGNFPMNFSVATGRLDALGPEARFDTILYIDVLEHIHDDRRELDRAGALLSPGGRIIVLSPAHQQLYSEFDAAIGHVRRYNRKSLLAAKPDALSLERMFYLDSVGLLASLGNRLLLRTSNPSAGQIGLWDGMMIPASTVLDRLLGFSVGKSIVAVFRRPMPG